jgi:hypothetical protein
VDYAGGVEFSEGIHPPVSFHGMAAATGGAFHNSVSTVAGDRRAVLVLVPRRAERALEAVETLCSRGHSVLASWKECGAHQLDAAWNRSGSEEVFQRIGKTAAAWVAASPAAKEFLARRMPHARVLELPTPYPLDVPGWKRDAPYTSRRGIFIGTREWREPSRRHRDAMRIAAALARRLPETRITVVNRDGIMGLLRALSLCGPGVRTLRPMEYRRYLDCMARHRIVLQRDASGVPGQVAGDAALAGVPCLGGNGMVDRLVFPHLPGADASDDEILACATSLLTSSEAWKEAVETAEENAMEKVSFRAFRERLSLVGSLGP